MSVNKISLFVLLIVSVAVVDCRSIRKRRQAQTNIIPQTASNIFSYGYNTIRDGVMPAINSNINRFSQAWDIYKQNLYQGVNQGIDRFGQGWNQFTQNFNLNRQYQNPYNNYNNYGYNNQPYGYQPQPNMYQNYGGYNQQPYYYGRNMPGPQQRYKRNIKNQ